MLHRIREAMRRRDNDYILTSIVEIDEAYFGSFDPNQKRGRGTESKVVVTMSLNDKGYPLFAKMNVVDKIDSKTIQQLVIKNIHPKSNIRTDRYSVYKSLSAKGYNHTPFAINDDLNKLMKWIHITISNAKAFIIGAYHGLDKPHLQSYLNKFCYRFNPRNFKGQLFNRLLYSCVLGLPITYFKLTL